MLVFIHHETRLVRIAGVTAQPAEWVVQRARNLSMKLADQASAAKFLGRRLETVLAEYVGHLQLAPATPISQPGFAVHV